MNDPDARVQVSPALANVRIGAPVMTFDTLLSAARGDRSATHARPNTLRSFALL